MSARPPGGQGTQGSHGGHGGPALPGFGLGVVRHLLGWPPLSRHALPGEGDQGAMTRSMGSLWTPQRRTLGA